jgi:hypothetical protein
MKITTLAILALALAVPASAHADRRSFSGGSDYQSNGTFGLGIELGEPDGLTGKYFFSANHALDFGVGEIYHSYYGGNDGLHLYADYLWHPKLLTYTPAFKLPFYIGVGGRLWTFDYACNGNNICTSASIFGIRVPIGLDFDLNNVPLDIFVQFVPTFDFYRNYVGRNIYLDVDFSVGIRYWF